MPGGKHAGFVPALQFRPHVRPFSVADIFCEVRHALRRGDSGSLVAPPFSVIAFCVPFGGRADCDTMCVMDSGSLAAPPFFCDLFVST